MRSFPRYHIRVSRREPRPDIWRAPPTREHSGEAYGSTGLAERSSLLLLLLLRSDQAVITRRVNRVACAPSREVEEEKREERKGETGPSFSYTCATYQQVPPRTTADTAARTGYTRNPASASSTPMRTDLPLLLWCCCCCCCLSLTSSSSSASTCCLTLSEMYMSPVYFLLREYGTVLNELTRGLVKGHSRVVLYLSLS